MLQGQVDDGAVRRCMDAGALKIDVGTVPFSLGQCHIGLGQLSLNAGAFQGFLADAVIAAAVQFLAALVLVLGKPQGFLLVE